MKEFIHQIESYLNLTLLQMLMIWLGCTLLTIYFGYRKDRRAAGIVLGILTGPLGMLILLVIPYGGDITCPHCNKRTWWVPKQPGTGPPLTSEPHLRCFRCGKIIWNEEQVRYGPFSPSFRERISDFASSIYKKIKRT